MVDLPPPVGPDKGDGFATFYVQIEIGENGFLVILVFEVDVIEDDISFYRARVNGFWTVFYLRFGVDQGEHAFCRGDRLLHFSKNTGNILDWPHHEGNVGDKRLNTADAHSASAGL